MNKTDWHRANLAWQASRPETQEQRTERIRRLEAEEMKTRILENNNDLLAGIIDQYRGKQ
jgi:hypothetical protein